MAYIYILKDNPGSDGKNSPLFIPVDKIRCTNDFLWLFNMYDGGMSWQFMKPSDKPFHTVRTTKKWIKDWMVMNEKHSILQDKRKHIKKPILFATEKLIPFLNKTKSNLYVDVQTTW